MKKKKIMIGILVVVVLVACILIYFATSQAKTRSGVNKLTDQYISDFATNRLGYQSTDVEDYLQAFYGISQSQWENEVKELLTEKVKEDPDFKLTDFNWDQCKYQTDDYWYSASRSELIQGTISKIEQINDDTALITITVQKDYLEETAPSDTSNCVKVNQENVIRVRIPCNGLQYISPYWNLRDNKTPLEYSDLKENESVYINVAQFITQKEDGSQNESFVGGFIVDPKDVYIIPDMDNIINAM